MSNRFYKILEKVFYIFFYIILVGLFLKGEVFRLNTKWFSLTFTSVKNFILVFIIMWLFLRIREGLRFSYYLLPILLLGIISLLFSIYPKETIRAIWVLLIYILWFYSLWYILRDEKIVFNTVILMISLAGLVNIFNLYFHYSVGFKEILEKYPFWQGKNALGLFLVMALCISGSLCSNNKFAWIWIINSILLTLGVLCSYSRSAWIACLVGVTGILFIRLKRTIIIIIGIIGIILLIQPSFISERFYSIFSGKDENVKQRLEVWENTLEMIKARPILGTGLGTFNEIYIERYFSDAPLKGESLRPTRHAHNLYLQILSETGVAGLLVFILLIFMGLIYAIKNFIKEHNRNIKSIRYGSLLGIIAFLVYSLTDCTVSWQFIGDSFSHINLIWIMLWVIALRPFQKLQITQDFH